ncbi:hypothetical protein [Roseivivax sp. CAU 1753]
MTDKNDARILHVGTFQRRTQFIQDSALICAQRGAPHRKIDPTEMMNVDDASGIRGGIDEGFVFFDDLIRGGIRLRFPFCRCDRCETE